MSIDLRISAAALALALAACGSGDEEEDTAAPVAAPAQDDDLQPAAAAPEASPTDDVTDEDADVADATPTPTPTATPTAAPSPIASASPTQAAAAKPAAFLVCGACHAVEPGSHGIGPSLAGVFGAKAGHASDFEYSQAMLDSGLTWNAATLDRYLDNPKGVVPGTTMSFAGVKDDAKRAQIVEYLKTL